MAKNRSMAIKHAKAKKDAIKQKTIDDRNTICARRCNPHSASMLWFGYHKPYSY